MTNTEKPLKDNYVSDLSTIKSWLKLPPTQRTLALCGLIIIVLFRMFQQERSKNDSGRDRADNDKIAITKACDEKVRLRDSIIAEKNEEIKFIYKTQADEYKKARKEVEEIRENSKNIKKKAEKLVNAK